MAKIYRFLLLLVILGSGIKLTEAQELSTQGTIFWMTFLENVGTPDNTPELKIVISCNKATSGTVKNILTGHSRPFAIGAGGGVDTVLVPTYMGYTTGSENTSTRKAGLLIQAADTVSVAAQNTKPFSCDAALIYPIEALGVDYRVFSFMGDPASPGTSSYRSSFGIVATEDNTSIEITPSVNTKNGNAANTKYTITLNKGESYQAQAATNKLDFSGTLVQALNCKKIAVFGGSSRSGIGPTGSNCATSYDQLYEQMMPINLWGKKFVVAPTIWAKGKLRRYELIKVVANTNSTVIKFNSRPVKILNAGQSDTFWMDSLKCKNAFIFATKAIGVCQYSSSEACDGGGFGAGTDTDPMMMWVPPIEQSLKSLNFSCENAQTINKFFLNVIVKSAYRGTFKIDGAAPTSGWKLINMDTTYSYLQQSGLSQGKHNMTSPYGFSAMLYAYGDHGSYGYNAGSSVKALSFFMTAAGKSSADFELDTPYYVVCQGSTIPFDVTASYIPTGWKWLINNPTGLVVKTSKSFSYVFPDTGMIKIRAVTTRPTVGICNGISTDTLVNFVKVFGRPKITLLKDTTICRGNSFYIASKTIGDTNYTFTPNTWLSCDKCFQPLCSPLMDTTYTVVATTKGCLPSRDTFKVKIRDSLFIFKSNDTTICRGTSTTLKASSIGGLTTTHTLTWDHGLGTGLTKTVAPKITTTYRVILTDGCTRDSAKNFYADTAFIKVTVLDSLKITMPNDTIVCEGNIVTLTPLIRGGRTTSTVVTWDNALGTGTSKTITMGPTTTKYRAILSDGCTVPKDTGFVTVSVRPGLRIDTIYFPTPVCRNTLFKVSMKLSGGDSTGYRVRLLNFTSGAPVIIDSFKSTAYPYFMIKIPDDSKFKIAFNQSCNANNAPLKPFDVYIKKALKVFATIPVDTICTGQSYNILATGGSPENLPIKFVLRRKTGTNTSIAIDSLTDNANASFKVTPTLPTTDYIIVGDDKCNRTDTTKFRLVVRPPLVLTTPLSDVELCRNMTTSFMATHTGGKVQSILYTWSDALNNNLLGSTQTVNVSTVTSMDVNLKVDDGCSAAVTDQVRIWVAPVVSDSTLVPADTMGCKEYSTTFLYPTTIAQPINPSFDWNWYFDGSFFTTTASVGGQTPNHTPIPQTYTIAGVHDGKIEMKLQKTGTVCNTFTRTIDVWEQAVADFEYPPTQIDIIEPLVTFTNRSTGATQYFWNFGDSVVNGLLVWINDNGPNTRHSYKDTGEFLVTLIATNAEGCADTTRNLAKYRLRVLDIFRIWIPNAFSPNTDLINTDWFPGVTSISKLEYEIYNRWGEKVFVGDENTKWLGQYTDQPGTMCPEGVYYYHIKVKDNRKHWHYYNGTLTLLR